MSCQSQTVRSVDHNEVVAAPGAESAWILWQEHPDGTERYEVRDAFPRAGRRVEWKIS
jgi:hypothetical protein